MKKDGKPHQIESEKKVKYQNSIKSYKGLKKICLTFSKKNLISNTHNFAKIFFSQNGKIEILLFPLKNNIFYLTAVGNCTVYPFWNGFGLQFIWRIILKLFLQKLNFNILGTHAERNFLQGIESMHRKVNRIPVSISFASWNMRIFPDLAAPAMHIYWIKIQEIRHTWIDLVGGLLVCRWTGNPFGYLVISFYNYWLWHKWILLWSTTFLIF